MSDQYGTQPGYPVQTAYPQQQQYGPPAPYYAQPAPRPALTREHRNAAMLAGGIGFAMFSLGAGAAFVLALLGLVVGILAAVFGAIGMSQSGGEFVADVQSFLDSVPVAIVAAVGIASFLLAVALMVGGVLVSIRIMKNRGVNRPVAITWSGLGIGVVGSWIASSFVSLVPSIFGSMVDGIFEGVVAGFSVLLAIALYAAVGVFVWWWMAHAMRAPAAG